MVLAPEQRAIIQASPNSRIFLSGPAGSGKTTAARERLRALLAAGVPAESILLLTPQRTLQEPYLDLLSSPERGAGGEVTPATLGGLARRSVELFWPLVAEPAGFGHPDQPPVFLTLETAQYFMARLVRPLLEEGYFESVTMDRNRLYSQILDNLNKSALIGFSHTEIGMRLDSAWIGEPAQRRVYADAQECANRFRTYCLENNLLDFSLQLEIFVALLWPHPLVRDYLVRTYRHLIYDNVEEDAPRAHDIVREWLPDFDSALLIYDQGGGYRRFLGADTDTAWALAELCETHIAWSQSLVVSQPIAHLNNALATAIWPESASLLLPVASQEKAFSPPAAFSVIQSRFYPQLLDQVAAVTHRLLEAGLPASEIVILAPYMADSLRFALMQRLERLSIPSRSHRPSRSLRDEPASRALLTLAMLAHPEWELHPPRDDVAYTLMQSIEGLDLVRAHLLAEITYRPRDFTLAPFSGIKADVQERITFLLGERFDHLRDWILFYRESDRLPFDHFLRKLFGEVLSQPGFGFHHNFDAVRVAASLVEAVRKFRLALQDVLPWSELGREYLLLLQEGVLAAQYLEGWSSAWQESVLVAPAYTYLMMNRPVRVQIWLDAGSSGWYERLSQPITHPYVLSRAWPAGRVWTDTDEVQAGRESMARLVCGLLHRCRDHLYIATSELGESGFEQRGELLRAFQRVLQGQAQM
ncbi:MAG: hypothetical protein DDG60_13255 [Anaerolineae bacterium]|nr:MAG: hypothetical protein DDG60_13255 [Anaerolineae bacterium]